MPAPVWIIGGLILAALVLRFGASRGTMKATRPQDVKADIARARALVAARRHRAKQENRSKERGR